MSDCGSVVVIDPSLFNNVFKKLIPVKCSVMDCDETQENFSIPVQLDDLNPPKKVIIFVCPKHHKQQNLRTKINYTFLQNQVTKQLKLAKIEDQEVSVYQAKKKLDQHSCCMRENTKTSNLDAILTKLQLFSGDDKIIFQLVRRLYIRQYFECKELKEKIKKGANNPLAILNLIHSIKQLKAQQQQILADIPNQNIEQPQMGSSIIRCYQRIE